MSERRPTLPGPAPPGGGPGGGVIVVAGEALIDLVIGSSGNLEAHPGGGPFNVAQTVGRLRRRCCVKRWQGMPRIVTTA
jgi:hypothetical protein